MRALANIFLRDLSMYLVSLDVVRGVPAVYTTFVGYDEVAHYAGPDTEDAMRTLGLTAASNASNISSKTAPRAPTISSCCPITGDP